MRRPAPLFLTLLAGLVLTACSQSVSQPIAFNHKKHIDEGVGCNDCHQHYEKSAFSGLPGVEICLECHEEAITDSAEEEKIRKYAEAGEEIPWNRVYQQPDHVYYSHRRHVVVAEIECKTCHGDVGAMTSPPRRPAVNQSMSWCMDCHEDRGATHDCIHCHK